MCPASMTSIAPMAAGGTSGLRGLGSRQRDDWRHRQPDLWLARRNIYFVLYFFRFPSSLSVLASFDWPSIDWKARELFFTGGVTNGS
jgi:hypothetical protein